MKTIEEIQAELRHRQIPAWLFFDHHHRDAISYRILGLPESSMVSRRWFYLVPAEGEPVKLLHRIEPHHLDALPGEQQVYAPWQELVEKLRDLLSGVPVVAMQFSPNNMIFTVSTADAGTVDLIRSFGVNVISSADLVARFEATWTNEQILSHFAAAESIDAIMTAVFPEIGRRVRSGDTNEFEIQQWLVEAFRREALTADAPPIVAVNQNSSDPHYAPTADTAHQSVKETSYSSMSGGRKIDRERSITTSVGRVSSAGHYQIAFAKYSTLSVVRGTQASKR
jgi:Xaa-Pro aminopeptidase